MGWFLYDNGLRHERVNFKTNFLEKRKIFFWKLEYNFSVESTKIKDTFEDIKNWPVRRQY